MPGMGELLIILLIVLLIFGAGKLPAIGDALGRSIKNFKRSATGGDEIEVSKGSAQGDQGQIEDATRGELAEGERASDFDDAELLASKKAKAE